MNIKEKFSLFNKNSVTFRELNEVISKLPTNNEVAKDILKNIGNNNTKIVLDEDIKNSYYVYLNDTIYLSNRKKVVEDSSRIILISHEARHSVQSKFLQKLNFLFSNIEILAFVINIIFFLLKKFSAINVYGYIAIAIISIVPRMILEFDAVVHSIKIAQNYMVDKISKEGLDKVIEIYKLKIKILMPLFVMNLIFGKLIRVFITIFGYCVVIS